ncbi:MAG: BrnT family toxin [Amaricoccus sp.]
MKVEFDPAKRARTLAERGLDMAEVPAIFAGAVLTYPDDRRDYGEPRFTTIGRLRGRMVVVVWMPRGTAYRIVSSRKANVSKQAIYGSRI